MAANGRLVWVPSGVKGLRIKGWENKIKNMPEDKTSDYATLSVYILDDVDPDADAGAQGNAAQMRHAQWCNNMRDTFNDTSKASACRTARDRSIYCNASKWSCETRLRMTWLCSASTEALAAMVVPTTCE
jgi:hypothetical protein